MNHAEDDAIFIQKNSDDKYVGQRGLLHYVKRPDPDLAEKSYDTISELIVDLEDEARKTDHGFKLCLESVLKTRKDVEDNPAFDFPE